MGRINVRAKGASGELEFCRWLYDNLNIPMPTRNLEQVRSGGADILDVPPFVFEVKRVQTLALYKWWNQVRKATENLYDDELLPVVAFRQDRKDWEFLISAKEIGIDKGYLRISQRTFLKWIRLKKCDENIF